MASFSTYVRLLAFSGCFCQIQSQLLKAHNHVIPGFERHDQDNWNGTYLFVQGTDPQPGLIDQIEGGNGSKWEKEIRRLNLAVTAVNDMKTPPAFLMITGDIVNAYPGEEPYKTEQTRDVLASLENIKVPTFVISGNHDLLNVPTPASIQDFRNQFGDDYYSFYYAGVMYIALNSQYFFNSSKVSELAREQMEWLDQQLATASSDDNLKHVVVFMHIPLFLSEADEPDNYFNIPYDLRWTIMNKFISSGVKIVFSGHYHRNAGGIYNTVIHSDKVTFECVVSSAIGAQLGEDKSGLRIVTVGESGITHKYYALENMPRN